MAAMGTAGFPTAVGSMFLVGGVSIAMAALSNTWPKFYERAGKIRYCAIRRNALDWSAVRRSASSTDRGMDACAWRPCKSSCRQHALALTHFAEFTHSHRRSVRSGSQGSGTALGERLDV